MIRSFLPKWLVPWLLFLSVIVTHASPGLTQESGDFIFDQNTPPSTLNDVSEFLVDPEGALDIASVVRAGDWKKVPASGLTAGFTDAVYWLRFTVQNTSPDNRPWNLEFHYALLDEIVVFIPSASGDYQRIVSGDHYPFSDRPIHYRNVVIPVVSGAHHRDTYYVRIKTESSMNVSMKLWPDNSLYAEVDFIKMLLGIFIGTVLLGVISSLANALILKESMYVWLSASLVGSLLFFCGLKGLNHQYLWPDAIWWSTVSIPILMNTAYAFTLQYTRMFTNLRLIWPLYDRLGLFLIIIGSITALLSLFAPYKLMITVSSLLVMINCLFCMSSGVVSWRKGNTSARLFVMAWSIFFLANIGTALLSLGSIPQNFFTAWGQETGYFFFVILMTIAQFDRYLQQKNVHESDQKKALEEIRYAEGKYRALFENSFEGMFQLDDAGRLVNANKAVLGMAGKSTQERLMTAGQHPFSLGMLDAAEADRLKASVIESESVIDFESSFLLDSGEKRWITLSIQRVFSDKDGITSYEGSIADITASKKREEAEKQSKMLEAASEAKSMFLKNMGVEIRTPISSVLSLVDESIGLNTDGKLAASLSKIKGASVSLLSRINEILDYTLIESGNLTINHAAFSLSELLQTVQEFAHHNARDKALSVVMDVDADIPGTLVGDAQRIFQLLTILLDNAIKYNEQGVVTLEMSLLTLNKENGAVSVECRVTDCGAGIAQEKIASIYDNILKSQDSSLGLGLRIARHLVDLMGDNLSVTSEPGQGTTVAFELNLQLESRKPAAVLGKLGQA